MAANKSDTSAKIAQKITEESIASARKALREAKPKPPAKITKRDAILSLKDEINNALKNGHTFADVSALLATSGISVKPDSIRAYIREKPVKESDTDVIKIADNLLAATAAPAPSSPPASQAADKPPRFIRVAVELPSGTPKEIDEKLKNYGFTLEDVSNYRQAVHGPETSWQGAVNENDHVNFKNFVERYKGKVFYIKNN